MPNGDVKTGSRAGSTLGEVRANCIESASEAELRTVESGDHDTVTANPSRSSDDDADGTYVVRGGSIIRSILVRENRG